MTCRGHIENGNIILDDPVELPEGTIVTLIMSEVAEDREGGRTKTDYERLASVIGRAQGLPSDLAENHDFYLHGRPKK